MPCSHPAHERADADHPPGPRDASAAASARCFPTPPGATEIRAERHGRGRVGLLSFGGELDLCDKASAEDAILRLEATAPARLILDLRGLEFAGSTVLQLCLGASSRATLAGRSLLVAPGSGQVRRLFGIAGLSRAFDFVDDSQLALDSELLNPGQGPPKRAQTGAGSTHRPW